MKKPESLWNTYEKRLRKLIFTNLPLLVLVMACLPLFIMIIPITVRPEQPRKTTETKVTRRNVPLPVGKLVSAQTATQLGRKTQQLRDANLPAAVMMETPVRHPVVTPKTTARGRRWREYQRRRHSLGGRKRRENSTSSNGRRRRRHRRLTPAHRRARSPPGNSHYAPKRTSAPSVPQKANERTTARSNDNALVTLLLSRTVKDIVPGSVSTEAAGTSSEESPTTGEVHGRMVPHVGIADDGPDLTVSNDATRIEVPKSANEALFKSALPTKQHVGVNRTAPKEVSIPRGTSADLERKPSDVSEQSTLNATSSIASRSSKSLTSTSGSTERTLVQKDNLTRGKTGLRNYNGVSFDQGNKSKIGPTKALSPPYIANKSLSAGNLSLTKQQDLTKTYWTSEPQGPHSSVTKETGITVEKTDFVPYSSDGQLAGTSLVGHARNASLIPERVGGTNATLLIMQPSTMRVSTLLPIMERNLPSEEGAPGVIRRKRNLTTEVGPRTPQVEHFATTDIIGNMTSEENYYDDDYYDDLYYYGEEDPKDTAEKAYGKPFTGQGHAGRLPSDKRSTPSARKMKNLEENWDHMESSDHMVVAANGGIEANRKSTEKVLWEYPEGPLPPGAHEHDDTLVTVEPGLGSSRTVNRMDDEGMKGTVLTKRRPPISAVTGSDAEVLRLTAPSEPRGNINFKAKGRPVPESLSVYCSVPAVYSGPFPVDICDKIVLRDAVVFDQTRVKFLVRSHGKWTQNVNR